MPPAWFFLAVHLAAMAGYAIAALSAVRCMRMLRGAGRYRWQEVLAALLVWCRYLVAPAAHTEPKAITKWTAFWLACNVSAVTSGLMFMAMGRALLNFPLEVLPPSYPYYLAGHVSVPLCFVFMHIGIATTWTKLGPDLNA